MILFSGALHGGYRANAGIKRNCSIREKPGKNHFTVMKEFFQNLKEIREQKGLTLEEISQRSRLSLKYLQAIEAGNLEALPKGYDRIFFRRYLKEIGENTPDIWQDFNLFFGGGPNQENLPYSSDIPSQNEESEKNKQKKEKELPETPSLLQELSLKINMDKLNRYFWVAVTVIVIGVVGFFAYRQFVVVKTLSHTPIKEITVSDIIEEMQRKDSLLTPSAAEVASVKPSGTNSVQIQMKALQRTWVREIRDEKDTTEYIMPVGFDRRIEAQKTVQFLLGRADGIQIRVNGKDLGVLGEADEIVVRLVLGRDGIIDKRLKKSRTKNRTPADSVSRE